MKILILITKWLGGVGRYVSEVKNELEKKGHEVKVLSREDDLKIFSFIKSIKQLREVVKKNKFDILYTQDWNMTLPFLFFKKHKHFCCFHGTQPEAQKILQGFVGGIIGDKLVVADSLNHKRFPKSHLIPNRVDMNQFRPLKKRREFLGWIDKESEIIRRNELEKLSKNLGIPLLIAKDFKPKEMNEKFYNRCKLFVSFPQKVAGCALSYMEAMAAGVPKIIGNNYGEGFKYPFEKIEDFKNLEDAIKNSKERDYRRWLEKNQLTWDKYVEKLLQLFELHQIA